MNKEVEIRSQRRRIVLMVMASAFLIWQVPAMDFFTEITDGGRILKDGLATIGFLVWISGLVYLLKSGKTARGGNPAVMSALEDELVQSNRSKAFAIGYFVTLATSALVFAISLIQPITGNDAAHLILVIAVTAPMYAFAVLEHPSA